MDGITNSVGMSLSNVLEMVKNREAWCAAVHGINIEKCFEVNRENLSNASVYLYR